jgi:C4-dicarboxylate-specific signal transduction histidine kinase
VSAPVTLRRELLLSFAVLFVAAVVVAVVGLLVLLPLLPVLSSPGEAALFTALLLGADVGVLLWFGHSLVSRRFVQPMEALTVDVRRIAGGEYEHRAEGAESLELRGLEASVNAMADRLIHDQQLLARNVESLEQTNVQLIEARAQVVQTARLASVGTLGAGIAHEVGNPLGAIVAYVDVARARAERTGGDTELLEQIRAEAMRIDRIVRSLLDYARPRQEEASALPPRQVVERVRELLETQGKLDDVQLEVLYGEDIPDVVMVPHRLEQVLVNLLLNAIDALGGRPDGRITLSLASGSGEVRGLPIRREGDPSGINYMHRRRVSRDDGGKGVDPLFTAERVVIITVSDNGPGIAEADREKVFDPFFTTKEPGKGTGLGLSICARLIEGMGGRITVDRADEGGARFTNRLPGATLEPEQAAEVLSSTDLSRSDR